MKPLSFNASPGRKTLFLPPAKLALISLFVMVFVMGLVKIYSPDLGFHLRSAEWIIHNRQFIHTDSFNYVAEGSTYYDMQWIFQLIVYGLYKAGGDSALVVANALLITSSILLVWIRFSRCTGLRSTDIKQGVFALLALVFVQGLTFEIRPHVFSWIFLNLTLLCLEAYKRGNVKALFFLPVIMLAWANTHSLSILGLATIAIYIAGDWLEKRRFERRLLTFFALSFVAFLITPYFIGGLLYAFSQFGLISGNSLLKAYVGELQSPFSIEETKRLGSAYFTSPLLIIHVAAVLSLFSIRRSVIQKHYVDALLLAAYLVVLYMAIKNYGYFLVVSLPLIAKYTLAWMERRTKKKLLQKTPVDKRKKKAAEGQIIKIETTTSGRQYKRLSIAVIIIAVFIGITSMTDSYALFRHSPYRFGITADSDQLPVEATDFLNRNHVRGKLLNHLDFGGYLMAHYDEKVFIDGRMDVLPEDFFKKYYESITMKHGIKKLLDEYNPDIVIFPYVKASYWWEYFLSKRMQSGYKAIYFDGLSVIFAKSGAYSNLPEVKEKDILPALDPTAINRLNACIETSKSKGLVTLFSGLWHRQSFSIADQNKSIYCFTNGFDTAALSYSIIGIENSTVRTPNIYKNLALYYQDKKKYDIAQLCADKSE